MSSSPDSSPCLPPPMKKARPLIFSDESPSSSQTAKPDVVDFKTSQQRVEFLTEAFPEIPRQVTEFTVVCFTVAMMVLKCWQ